MTKSAGWILVIVSMLALFSLNCRKNPVGPPPPVNDTTSHAFTFQQFSWGGGGSSYLQDVAILSDTNIWCVGEIQLPDSIYNVAHWDGVSWKLIKLLATDELGSENFLNWTGILVLSPTDIWLADGTGIHKFDGNTITQSYWISPSAIKPNNTILGSGQFVRKVWGTSDNNLYAIATGGGIAHFDGSNWQKLSSPTQLDFMNIYGATNQKTGELEVLAIATQVDSIISRSQLLRIQGTSVSLITTLPKIYFSLWFVPGEKYYVVGDGIISTNSSTNLIWSNISIGANSQFEAGGIRGADLNDVFVTGGYLDVVHYNGSTWFDYVNQLPSGYGSYSQVAIRGNTMIAVGAVDQNAVLLMGKL